jgi:glycosyltransferase involved in cell wall biosynthesis
MSPDAVTPSQVAMLVQGKEVYGIGTVQKLYAEAWPDLTFVCLGTGPLYDFLRERKAKVELVEGLVQFHEEKSLSTLAKMPFMFRKARRDARRIDERLAGRGIRIIHTHWRAQHIMAGYLRRRGYRAVWHVHNHTSRSRMFGLGMKLNHGLARWGADLILSVSDYVAANWRASGVPVKTVHAGTPQLISEPKDLSFEGPIRCLVAGRLVDGKGHHVAVDAVTQARKAGSDVTLDLYGGPLENNPYADELRRRIDQSGMTSTIRLMGLCTDLRQQQANYHLALQCGSQAETFGMSVCEAMVDGLAVLAADSGGVPELMEDGVSGYLVKPGDAEELAQRIVQLDHDRKLLATMRLAAFERGQRMFNPKRFCDETLAAYGSLK